MARPIRLQLPGACYLVTTRARQPGSLFPDIADRRSFVDLLGLTCARYRWRCHAWCLADDQYRLVLTTELASLAPGMRRLHSVYSQRLQRRHGSGGNLFEGRYESLLVDPAQYLFEAVARAFEAAADEGLSPRAADWAWSSYAATVGTSALPDWLDVRALLASFDADPAEAALAFAGALSGRRREPLPTAPGPWLADADFVARTLSRVPRRAAHGRRRTLRPPLAEFSACHRDRRDAMRAAWRSGCYSQKEIARHFNVHTATVARAVAPDYPWTQGGIVVREEFGRGAD